MITVPLAVKGKVLGSLQLLNKKQSNFFAEEDVSLAVALASQSAMARPDEARQASTPATPTDDAPSLMSSIASALNPFKLLS